ncbi:peptidase family M48-domain-containing protein [Gigaspora rosea]|uniref:CAAX prenyl protease n=1 Tax=Gigaspora rosea TaxID=44941 RepID=A0A397U4S2_9GLOM|nr:peptidase family M48-domain-containing protein [Gigaspora rosea]
MSLLGFDLTAPGTPYKEFVLIFSWVVYTFEQYLSIRQYYKLKEPNPPKSLQDIEEVRENFKKTQAYGLDKAKYGFVSALFGQIQSTIIIVWDILPFLWDLSGKWLEQVGYGTDYEIIQSLIFTVNMTLMSYLLSLPLSLYYTFVIEERHGFNKMTLGLFFMDLLKGFLIAGVIGLPILALVLQIIRWTGDNFYFYVWIFMIIFNLVLLTIYPTLIQPLFNKVEPLEKGDLRERIEELASRIGFPLKKLYVIDGSKRSNHSNAYFYGFFKNKRIVLYDTLIDQADTGEILAIVGHELGHWYLNHTVKVLVVSQIHNLFLFYVFSQFIHNSELYSSFGFTSRPTLIGFLLFQFIYSPIENIFSFLMNIKSRQHEFEADAYSKKLGYGAQLRSGLIKIQLKNLSNLNNDKWFSAYHFSHPPLPERLSALEKID